ncbi:MAG: hypothetical protein NTW59_00030 [Candidatus Diapherotrites archaeon]|nr:hypothetical protein [Candidatus Diapherotrites archaeon]
MRELHVHRGQIATEYLIVTGFILALVTVIFGYSYVNYDQNIKINQANAVLDMLVNKADYVYALGPDNNQFAEVLIPSNVSTVRVTNLCNSDGAQETCVTGAEESCDCRTGVDHGGVKRSALEIVADLVGGPTMIGRIAKTPIVLRNDLQGNRFPCTGEQGDPLRVYCDGKFRIKVYWQPGDASVSLQKV